MPLRLSVAINIGSKLSAARYDGELTVETYEPEGTGPSPEHVMSAIRAGLYTVLIQIKVMQGTVVDTCRARLGQRVQRTLLAPLSHGALIFRPLKRAWRSKFRIETPVLRLIA